jgi:GT2 family glycosyltransferase/glycosyltransferase involved in cell wall biosynthesis
VSARDDAGRLTAGILILNWNGRDLLREHLPSVVTAAAHSGIEVAVADNGSTDGSVEYLEEAFSGVTVLPLGENLGFGAGYNHAVDLVSWDIVILLNNDMLVAEDFAEHLLAPFSGEASDGIFAVTAQIHFQDQDRRRDETGRTSARYAGGELQCAHLPIDVGDALQPVLWAGGGSSAVSRAKFLALGGFEELYNPFYVEDLDLSFRAWQRGWATYLAPAATVYHRHRGSTSKLDPKGVETIVARNRTLFVLLNSSDPRIVASHLASVARPTALRRDGSRADYRALLEVGKRLPAVLTRRRQRRVRPDLAAMSERDVLAQFENDWLPDLGLPDAPSSGGPAVRGGRPLRVLVLVPISVYPVSHGGATRVANTAWGLSRLGHEVHVLSFVGNEEEREAMLSMPEVAGSYSFVLPLGRELVPGGLTPTVVRETYRPDAREIVQALVRKLGIDVVELDYTHAAAYLPDVRSVPAILIEHDVAYRSAMRAALAQEGQIARARKFFDALRLYRWELEHARKADLVLAVSEEEADILRSHGVTRVSGAVPSGVDVAEFEPSAPRREVRDILFLGYFLHTPNVDALRFLIDDIWPLLGGRASGLSVTIAGKGLNQAMQARVAEAGFDNAGFVEDLHGTLWSHRVFVSPIRYGAGIRIKLLEAAAARCAIVSTTLGAEGLGFQDGVDLLIADTPEEFAAAVRRLLDDSELRRRLGDSAHDRVKQTHDWANLARRLESVIYDLLESRPRGVTGGDEAERRRSAGRMETSAPATVGRLDALGTDDTGTV